MNKRFLLSELDDENYAYAKFSFHKEYKEAAKNVALFRRLEEIICINML